MNAPLASVLETIGRTPVVRLDRLAPPGASLYAKLEAANPGGSVKDRMALAMIEAAEASGELRPGQTVVEASSGNTGIALAMVCAAKGYPLVIVMAEQFSVERRRLMRFLGARVVLTPAHLKGSGMVEKAGELARRHGWFWPQQFENEANADVHARTTAVEILASFEGRRLDYVVLGTGTGGTARGLARVLRQQRPETRLVLCEPDNAPVLSGGPAAFRPHPMQGWTPDFVSHHSARLLEEGGVHQVLAVSGEAAITQAHALARREGILAGITSGATVAGAMQLLEQSPDAHVLVLLPDTGERYLSTPLFDAIDQDMDAAEWDISRSSPFARFDQAPAAAPAPAPAPTPAADEQARQLLAAAISDPAAPLVVYGLSWCEFGWSVRKLFDALGADFRWINLDDPELLATDLGIRLRAALEQHTGCRTLPQVFLGGQFLGGCSETFAANADGSLADRLDALGHPPRHRSIPDAGQMLPAWRQKAAASAGG
ncbi:hypothetical protein GCM10027193_00730 [Arenimonas aestuarii]